MISKIIQKEKERQERYFKEIKEVSEPNRNYVVGKTDCHKQSLINLKEYLEEQRDEDYCDKTCESDKKLWKRLLDRIDQIEEDIKELKEMIGRYE